MERYAAAAQPSFGDLLAPLDLTPESYEVESVFSSMVSSCIVHSAEESRASSPAVSIPASWDAAAEAEQTLEEESREHAWAMYRLVASRIPSPTPAQEQDGECDDGCDADGAGAGGGLPPRGAGDAASAERREDDGNELFDLDM